MCLIPALIITITYGEHLAAQEYSRIIEQKEAKTLPIVSRFETELLDIVSLIEITAKQDSVTTPPDPSLLVSKLHGVGEYDELEKRALAKTILYNRNDIDTVFFVLPNGDMYMIEPYQRQLDVVSTNFAFRDWYIGLMKTNGTYVSELFSPQGKTYNTIGIVTPVKSPSGEFVGIWGALINLDEWTNQFASIKLNKNEYVFLVDHNGNLIVDSRNRAYKVMDSLLHLKSVNEVLKRKSGTVVETLHGSEMFVMYVPIIVGSHTWGIIVAEPHSNVFSSINSIRFYYVMTTAVILSVALIAILSVRRFAKRGWFWSQDIEKIWQMEDIDPLSREIPSIKTLPRKSNRMTLFAILTGFLMVASVLYFLYVPQIVPLEEMKSAFVVQNLRGDTIDTWVNWKISAGDLFHIHVMDSQELTESRLKIINNVINSRETVTVDDSLLHKGLHGTSSVYYVGWRGALESLSNIRTKYPIPITLHTITTDEGDGHIVIRLSDLRSSDGYSGYTKSYVDEENHQILKSVITIYDVNNITDEQLAIILRHEIGHGLGLGHSTAPEDLMAPTITTPYPYISECALDALIDLYNGNAKSQFVCEK
ncbi:cache domain-containing protein [Candidatus Nitrosotenuis uzonensis]|uniref:cache domain-containing protein n=1 Tax=Candidatus Nitrosotenuis uzonensis TaxID=1407055 RepID=UPI0006947DD8|nr:cache domain-containing protein [Candidatus Nitrosotenuis uzonensis]